MVGPSGLCVASVGKVQDFSLVGQASGCERPRMINLPTTESLLPPTQSKTFELRRKLIAIAYGKLILPSRKVREGGRMRENFGGIGRGETSYRDC